MKSLCDSSLEPQGRSSIRRADPTPPALPHVGAAPGLTLLTTMKPLESMLMPLCLRKPVAGTAPGGKPKPAAAVSGVPQPWEPKADPKASRSPPARTVGLPPGTGSSCSGSVEQGQVPYRASTASASGPPGSLSCPSHQCNLPTALFLFYCLEIIFYLILFYRYFEKNCI